MDKKDDAKDIEFQELLQNLERQTDKFGLELIKYSGFWSLEGTLRPILSCQKNFKAKNSDIILSTMPKSGTTWLKALVFAIVNRENHPIDQSPLLTSNPHELVPFFEFMTYMDEENPNLEHILDPRIFSTHMSFSVLPNSIRESECRIIYMCRNILDQFVSYHHFALKYKLGKFYHMDPITNIEESFDSFCQGIQPYGPLWDQMLEYWNAHQKNPQKVLFLKYEDLKKDISFYVRQIAEFIGLPFSLEEEKQGMIEQISKLCSFENLKNLEVNKTGGNHLINFSSLFRKGEVGDWKNYLTPAMAERLEKLVESKLRGSGLFVI